MAKDAETVLFLGVVGLAYGQPQAECPKDGHHYLIPDESDCSKYYPCVNGRKFTDAFQCPENTLFSFEIQACAHASQVKCQVGPIAIEAFSCCNSKSGKCVCRPPVEESEEIEEEIDEGEVVWLPNGCPDPRNRTVDKLLPHPDCSKYYQCVDGDLVERPCADDTYFSYEHQRCEWAHIANCTPGEIPPGVPTPAPSPGDNGNNNCNGGLCPEGEIDLLPNGCPKNYSYEMLLPHPNCEKYYQCVHGDIVARPCAKGTHFSFELQRCDWPEIAKCVPGEIPDEDCDCECDSSEETGSGGDSDDCHCENTPAPGDNNTPAPGDNNTPAPGDNNTPAPGDNNTPAPGDNNTPAPGDNNTPAPGDNELLI
ncbi:probable chitinase 10 [Colias croceus]|uniref:probable chitinase 10 n=1 Tax=Colias crocea TaxID=72248 RepID=UPI001E27B193|nr:probable chitinase 10 [Colias croceus]